MKKTKCGLCGKNRARRKCNIYYDKFICSPCCADLRNAECVECRHFKVASQYHSSKDRQVRPKPFIVELNEEVESAVDRALVLVEKGKIAKARDMLNGLKKNHPNNHMVMYGFGVIHAMEGQYDEAIRYFTKATDIFPYFIEAHFNKGVAYKQKLDIRNTVESFKKVIEIGDPENEQAQQAKDLISSFANEIQKTANITLEEFFVAQDRFEAAFSHMEKGEWEKAIFGFKECLKINKHHPQSYGNLGICFAQLGRRSEALVALDRALEIDPRYEPAIVNKAMIERLQEGERLKPAHLESIEYYKEFTFKKKSFIQSMLNRVDGRE